MVDEMRSIDQLLAEADRIIEKKASTKVATNVVSSGDDVDKLASMLEADLGFSVTQEKVAAPKEIIDTPFEKIARSLAIAEALVNLNEMKKIAEFEAKAKAAGYSESKINEYIEKKASETISPLGKLLDILG